MWKMAHKNGWIGKLAIKMAILNSYVSLTEGNNYNKMYIVSP